MHYPQVRYGPAFYKQLAYGESAFYKEWMLKMFPQLQKRFEAMSSPVRGYSSEGQAKLAAAMREARWAIWLRMQQGELRKQFYSMPPSQRGEGRVAPRLRYVSG